MTAEKFKRTEEKIKQAVEEWEVTFNSIPDLLSIQDPDFRIIKVNRVFADAFGVEPGELLGKKCYEIFHRAGEPWPNCPHKQTLESGKQITEELWEPRLGKYLQVSTSPICNEKGETIGTIHIARDITERKRAEAQLKASERKFRDLTEATLDWIWEVDKGGRYTYVSPRVKDLLGYEVSEVLGKIPFDFMPKEEAERAAVIFKEKAIKKEPIFRLENINRHKNGHLVVLETSGAPILDEQGKLVGYRGIDRDITERKRAEEALADRTVQLERMNRELAALNAELDEFTNVASHDLQEPLRTLSAFSKLLQKDLGQSLPEQAAQDLAFITNAAERMKTLIKDLLALSRAGRVAKKREKVSLYECADQALEALTARVKETGAKISRDELPDVWGDATLLTQLYQNLIGNALKFSGDQYPILQLTFEEKDKEQIFGVKDNGIGIEPKYARQIFEPFIRLHGRDEFEGTGIGLAICRKIVERHGGKIWVESEPGKGAHFRFTICRRMKER